MPILTECSQVEWQIWYQDLFDRECPRRIEMCGRGLVEGLVALWARHLLESVRPDGGRGFSRFNLWWVQESVSIAVVGDWEGQVRLRRWVFGERESTMEGALGAAAREMLHGIASWHGGLVARGETSKAICARARMAPNREAFARDTRPLGLS